MPSIYFQFAFAARLLVGIVPCQRHLMLKHKRWGYVHCVLSVNVTAPLSTPFHWISANVSCDLQYLDADDYHGRRVFLVDETTASTPADDTNDSFAVFLCRLLFMRNIHLFTIHLQFLPMHLLKNNNYVIGKPMSSRILLKLPHTQTSRVFIYYTKLYFLAKNSTNIGHWATGANVSRK